MCHGLLALYPTHSSHSIYCTVFVPFDGGLLLWLVVFHFALPLFIHLYCPCVCVVCMCLYHHFIQLVLSTGMCHISYHIYLSILFVLTSECNLKFIICNVSIMMQRSILSIYFSNSMPFFMLFYVVCMLCGFHHYLAFFIGIYSALT